MRIVTVLTSLGIGGAERQALAVAGRLAGRGHQVTLLVLMPPLPDQWPTSLPVVHLGMSRNPARLLAGFWRGLVFLRRFRPQVVHSHSFHANLLARLLAGWRRRMVVISTVHNVYEGGRMRMLAYRLTDGFSRRTVAVSAAAAERFVRLRAVSANKCLVRANGIDLAEFLPNAERRASLRGTMDAAGSFVWLSAGRITAAKDYPNLVAALEKLAEQRPDAALWIAGEGTAQNREALENDCFFCKVQNRVRLLGLRRDMPALLDAADGFVLASAWEGMPLVVGEAMAMEKPVVATDVGGVRELLGEHGLPVLAKQPVALAEALLAVMQESAEERSERGRAARQRIAKQFNIDAVAEWWEKLYRELAGTGD